MQSLFQNSFLRFAVDIHREPPPTNEHGRLIQFLGTLGAAPGFHPAAAAVTALFPSETRILQAGRAAVLSHQ
jgi:hypothetical protein